MLCLLLKVFVFMFLAIIWYYSVVFLSFVETLVAKSVQCLLIVYELVGRVTGARGDDKEDKEKTPVTEGSSSKSEGTSSASASPKKRKHQKVNDEPKFGTKLTVPIETIIEETLNEELSDSLSSSEKAVISKPRRKKKPSKKDTSKLQSPPPSPPQVHSDLEDSGFVFVKNKKSPDKESKNSAFTVVEPEPVRSVTSKPKTAKGKSLLEKRNSAEALTSVITQSITKKRDPLSTPIIEHYKGSSTSNVEVKESKKVSPKVSYASVVTNNTPTEEAQVSESNISVTKDQKPVQTEESSLTIPVQPELPQVDQFFPDTIKEIDEILKEEFDDQSSEGTSSPDCLAGGSEKGYVPEQESEENFEDPLQDLEDEIIEQPFIVEECEVEVSVKENSALDISQVIEEAANQNQTDQNPSIIVSDCLKGSSKDLLEDQVFQSSTPEGQNTAQQDKTDKNLFSQGVVSDLLEDQVRQSSTPEGQHTAQLDQTDKNLFSQGVVSDLLEDQVLQSSTPEGQHTTQLDQTDKNPSSQGVSDLLEDHSFHSSTPEGQHTAQQDQTDQNPSSQGVSDLLEGHSSQSSIPEDPNPIDQNPSSEGVGTELLNQVKSLKVLLEGQILIPQVEAVNQEPTGQKSVDTESIIQNLEQLSEDQIKEDNILQDPILQVETVNQEPTDKGTSVEAIEPENFNQYFLDQCKKEFSLVDSIELVFPNRFELIEDPIQYLEDEIIAGPFVIEEPEVVYPVNSVSDICEDTVINSRTTEESQSVEEPEEMASQIRILTLNDKEHQECTIYRIEKKVILQFRLGPTLLGRKIKLYCNYPVEINGKLSEFERGTYQELSWCQDEGCKHSDDTALFAEIIPTLAGSFHYYFVYEDGNLEEKQGSGYFIVDPVLTYGDNDVLPLDCIQCQTALAKQLGQFSSWESKLLVAKESGYNVVHFTPIQELGASNSSYSLSEQLKLNPIFTDTNGKKPSFEDIEALTTKMRKEWKVLSLCDIVLNHTANESEWIKEHPEATYNCLNCPYLRPAYLLDAAFHQFSMEVKQGFYETKGIPPEVCTEEHLNAIKYHFKLSVLDPLKIHELFIVNVNKYIEEFITLARKTSPTSENDKAALPELVIIQDPDYKRLGSSIDVSLALKKYNLYRLDSFDEESRVKKCAEDLKIKLDSLNEALIKEVDADLNAAVDNVIAGIRYFRVQADGPKFKEITISHPLVYRYFTDYGSPGTLKETEEIMYSDNGKFLMAHNGWVMSSDPLKNFADVGTKTYIRRELIAWGDSVKLRFGDKPEDCPFLWDYMRKYVEQTVKIFDGVRLDNCHSTPIPVAEYLLDCARKIRPDLYVVAELFTNSDLTDNIFVNRLGITSLVREAMSAWDSHEEGRLVYRYGGVPVGSFYQPNIRPLVPMVAHALFLDLTHDNPSPVEKRSVFDMLPSTALVNMACCASGSNRGYDELVPHHIHVVDEDRQYAEWSEDETLTAGNVRFVNSKSGIIAAKKALNQLHFKLGSEGYNQVYVDQMDPDVVAVTRHNPETHISYVLVAFTAFSHPDVNAANYQRDIKPLRVEGVLDEIVLEATLSHLDALSGGSKFTKFEKFTKDSAWINGLSEYRVSVKQHIQPSESDIFSEVNSGSANVFQLNFSNFKPGSVVVIKVSLPEETKESATKIRQLISSLGVKKDTELTRIISNMTLADLNRALYRCDREEKDEGYFDVYNIPNFGSLVYAGLQGFMSLLATIRSSNDLGHPFCGNLRDGNWMIDYIWKRLKVDEGTKDLGQWIEENTKYLRNFPRYLIPCYFDVIVTSIYMKLLDQSYSLMSGFVKHGSTFVRALSLGSLQFGGYIKSADLPTLSPNLAPPKPPTRKNANGESVQACVTLSAGLPHFSVGYMRNWGRDTFIALRGLFILTGRFEEARQHILGYAACLRHGLIPNLLDGGRNSRFNCRDAIWWWLYCIKSYSEEAPNGVKILDDVVSRIFPTDESTAQPPGAVDQPLKDVIQESLTVHFQGLKFRERNAGRQIDEHMTDAGFNNQIGIHPETGFVFGGNQWNCGTWMDKMGSSDKAGNRGKPATPRDGSAVELVGLSKAAVTWLAKLNSEGKYPYDGVERVHKNGTKSKWTFKEWAEKIQKNFENKFWIGSILTPEETRPDLVNKKNIYKDSYGASQQWTDYQLRCNFPIAMVAAPELFDPQHAWNALEQAEKYLLGPLGMKTLDPEDWNYRGDYDNSNDSNDFHTAHGFNYHQGPEWVWPIGFFLRAKLIFAAQNGLLKETLASIKVILSKHFTELQTSPWRGLPELTNSAGSYCQDSSRTQAWSMSCILEVLYDLQQAESNQTIVN